ncbi:MAG: type II secretion system F family protein [Armatimonadetes bacterium]|nr:type II secretion system F family protein [Armatimonadota bacterium]
MPTYRYSAMDPTGRTVNGTLEADSFELVRAKLSDLSYHVLSIKQAKSASSLNDMFANMQRVKLRDLVMFSRQFATMIDAGLSVVKCLDILQKQTRNPKMKEVIGEVKRDVAGGSSLTEALQKHPRIFSALYVNMMRSAEAGGILDQVLDRLAGFLEKEQETRNKIKSAMTYPAVVFCFATLMLLGLLFFVLPKFKGIFETMGLDLPLTTKILLNSSDYMKNYWYVGLVFIVGSVVLFKIFARTDRGKYAIDAGKLKLPIFGDLILKTSVSRFARTFGTLITSGVPVLRALEIVSDTSGNRVISDTVVRASQSIKEGEKISTPLFGSKIFPVMVTQMIAVGEETGRLDQMLTKVANFYDDEVDNTLKGLTSLIEPLMIVGLGLIVGFIAVSVISPIYSLVGSLGG